MPIDGDLAETVRSVSETTAAIFLHPFRNLRIVIRKFSVMPTLAR